MGGRIWSELLTVRDGASKYNIYADAGPVPSRIGEQSGDLSICSNGLFRWNGSAWTNISTGGSSPGGVTTVAKSDGDYSTIQAALDAAAAGSLVLVYPGTYSENIDFTGVAAGVRLVGVGAGQAVIINGADTTSSRIVFNGNYTIREITVVGPSSGSNPAIDADLGAGELGVIFNVVVQGAGGSGHLIHKTGAGLLAAIGGLYHNGGAVGGSVCQADAGTLIATNWVFNAGSCTDGLLAGGATVIARDFVFQSSALYSCTTAVQVSSGIFQCSNIIIPETNSPCTNALRISGDGVEVDIQTCHLHSTTYDFLVDPALAGTGTKLNIVGDIRIEKLSIPSGWLTTVNPVVAASDSGVQNDPTYRIWGEASVGLFDNPSELAVGQGDSVVPDSVYTYDASAGTYTDVTEAAQSRSGSTFQMPGDLGDRMYVGFSRKYVSIKTDIAVAAVLGSGEIQTKMWTGAAYANVRILNADADDPHIQRGQAVFQQTASEQIRLDIEGEADPSSGSFGDPYGSWSTEDPMSAGTSYYYIVFEVITANLSTPPTLERLKVGGNRIENNPDGFTEWYGLAEGERKSIPNSGRTSFTGGGSPASATFQLSANVTITKTLATFSNNSVEGFTVEHIMPRGVDTSRMFQFDVEWVVDGVAIGDVELEIDVSDISIGLNIDNGSLPEISDAKVTTITSANDDGVLLKTSFYFALPDALSSDTISVSIFRDATGGNPDDTLSGSIKIWDTDLKAVRWTAN